MAGELTRKADRDVGVKVKIYGWVFPVGILAMLIAVIVFVHIRNLQHRVGTLEVEVRQCGK